MHNKKKINVSLRVTYAVKRSKNTDTSKWKKTLTRRAYCILGILYKSLLFLQNRHSADIQLQRCRFTVCGLSYSLLWDCVSKKNFYFSKG